MSLIAEGCHHQGLSTLCPQITTRYIHNMRLGGWALTCALRHMYGLSIQGSPTPFLSSKQLVQDEVVNHTHHYLVYTIKVGSVLVCWRLTSLLMAMPIDIHENGNLTWSGMSHKRVGRRRVADLCTKLEVPSIGSTIQVGASVRTAPSSPTLSSPIKLQDITTQTTPYTLPLTTEIRLYQWDGNFSRRKEKIKSSTFLSVSVTKSAPEDLV